jgi:hypothetical protein
MAMNGTTNYGTPPAYGAQTYAGGQPAAAPQVPADMQALNASIDAQLRSQAARGAVPTSMPQSVSAPVQTTAPTQTSAPANDPATDPADQGNVSWALLMEMKQSSGQALSPAETARYQAMAAQMKGGPAPTGNTAPASAPAAAATDPADSGNIAWALLMEMKQSTGGLSPAEQARYQGIMARANQGQPTQTTANGQNTVPMDLPTTGGAPTQPDAGNVVAPTTATQPMNQKEYDVEVKWAVGFEKSANAKRYNAYNTEKKIRSGQAEGKPAMSDQQFASEGAWAQTFSQSADIIRYKRIAGEVKRRQAAGESTKPTGGILDKVKSFFSGLTAKFMPKKAPASAPQTGQTAPAPTGA